ncbi:MAG: hypothetical protein P8I61_05295 [Opitutae bacterium]|nr:hypothetical protein [Opitutae bacterium]
MKIKKLILCGITFLLLSNANLFADLYEGFDFTGKKELSLGKEGAYGGETSSGWMSAWQIGSGDAVVSKKDIQFEGLSSTGGSVVLKGQRKNQNFFAKGFAFRQTDTAYEGDVYGSYRVIPGFMTEDSVVSMIFALPNTAEMSVKNGLFAISPKRWGGELGMIGAKGKTYKAVDGVPCVKGEPYLVIWKMSQLPAVGNVSNVSLTYWVLNAEQVEYFASKGFESKYLNLAEPGALKNNVCQFGRKDLKQTKRSLYKGIVLTPFIFNTNNVTFDEIRISSKGIKDAVGLK